MKNKFIDHPNKNRNFLHGQVHDAKPGQKSHRIPVDEEVIMIGKKLRRLMLLFNLREEDVWLIAKIEYREGVGKECTTKLIDPMYGPGFNLRAKTRMKYLKVIEILEEKEKQFALFPRLGIVHNARNGKHKQNNTPTTLK